MHTNLRQQALEFMQEVKLAGGSIRKKQQKSEIFANRELPVRLSASFPAFSA